MLLILGVWIFSNAPRCSPGSGRAQWANGKVQGEALEHEGAWPAMTFCRRGRGGSRPSRDLERNWSEIPARPRRKFQRLGRPRSPAVVLLGWARPGDTARRMTARAVAGESQRSVLHDLGFRTSRDVRGRRSHPPCADMFEQAKKKRRPASSSSTRSTTVGPPSWRRSRRRQ